MYRRDIKEVTEDTCLGVKLQENRKWTSHIKDAISIAKKYVDILRGLMYLLSRKSIERLYVTVVRPILEYGAALWDNCNDYEKDQLERVQQMGMRAIKGAKRGTGHDCLFLIK